MTSPARAGPRPITPIGERLRRNGAEVRDRMARAWAARPSWSRRAGVATAVAVVLVLGTALLLDPHAVAWVATLRAPTAAFFRRATRFGQSDWLLIPSGLLLIVLMLGAWQRIDRRAAAAWAEIGILLGAFFVVVAGSGIAVDIVKPIVGRERPTLFGTDGAFAFRPFSMGYEVNGFPSGHATTMGAVIVFAALLSWRLAVPVLIAGLVVSVSRVAVQAHYPSDVVAGFLFGGAYAYLFLSTLAKARVGFSIGAGGLPQPRLAALRGLRRRGRVAALARGLWRALRGG